MGWRSTLRHIADRDAYSGVRVYSNDKGGVVRKTVLAGLSNGAKCLREAFACEQQVQEAKELAEAERQRIQGGEATMGYLLTLGELIFPPNSQRGFAG
ncbi:hypothetical protein [Microbulbifer thermotolerans]|uniref:Uncharacterized protein n=1 Tax=Microbulbifer thermotolerans TaxID=252514 RepID=A0A143HMA7_MICTH|nr:hypothetical protein [Microbulbifer thermotolerans]AMX02844.1 hypothetical protein A3224_09850 [Microbulbifer thermotolerans]MCX2781159.1 hypothetical protein [Microbulbifer thermotolerans]MCX2803420.1 hypothetical protein [Microbulbifer thermotolerans]MCX2806578.1 hypothetical protein [Microbulbifer thermotolerans]MCX2836242.1 hypothetical protein [Microbulbifer thermotolerans]